MLYPICSKLGGEYLIKIIRILITLVVFGFLWRISGEIWEAFMPLDGIINLIFIIVGVPLLIVASILISGVTMNTIKKG